jgi:RND family efflux transporter MFP subunit
MNKSVKHILLAVTALTIASCGNNRTNDAKTAIAIPVSVQELEKSSINKLINTSGTAQPIYTVDLVSEISGKYHLMNNPATGRPFRLGDYVQKGQTVIQLEDREYENSIAYHARKLNLEIAEQEQSRQDTLYRLGGVTQLDLRNTELKVINAKTELETATINLEKMTVKSPFAGIITSLPYFTPGIRVTAGKAMLSIMNYSGMYLDINMPESAINYLKPQQKAYITHYTIPGDTLTGTISELSPAISYETRTFKGKIIIDNNKMKLRPGMFVKADIVVDHADSSVVIPKDIIMTRNKQQKYVFIVEKNTAVRRDITTGLEDDRNAEILTGLNPGDNLVVKGYETLKADSKVKIQQ